MKYILFFILFINLHLLANVNIGYYLPTDTEYNPAIPTPKSILGYEVGKWHVRHDQLVEYMKAVAKASDRIAIIEYARSHERRPLLLLTITSPENQQNIENIRIQHLSSTVTDQDMETMPAVVYMGYSIHGNEPSGSNAALLVAYYLAAAQGEKINSLLQQTVILLDPCFNPDGLNRFSSWVNTHKSRVPQADSYTREHNEVWPQGRTNHYWFDLNRDWLLVQHPESIGRIRQFQRWRPNVLTDHHEMGTNSTYFFQPGVPKRTHPLTPDQNQKLTGKMAEFHAQALDKIGSFYYTQERFDDFYYGKGSTYPDVQGGVGILFEQASSRGHLQESINGPLSFSFTIRNQVTTSLSTLAASQKLRIELLKYQHNFYTSAILEAKADKIKAYVVGDEGDSARLQAFIKLLLLHKIKVYQPEKVIYVDGKSYTKDNSYIIPLTQPQYRLIRSIFEKRTTFKDSIFYDVSAWTLPLAFNLPFVELDASVFANNSLGKEIEQLEQTKGKIYGEDNYSYLFSWNHYYAPRAVYQLLSEGYNIKVATKVFYSQTSVGNREFDYGTILIPRGIQDPDKQQNLRQHLEAIAQRDGIDIYAVKTGLTPLGMDLGSNNFQTLTQPTTLMLIGSGVRSYDAGEVWHLFDQRYFMGLSMVETHRLGRIPLSRYNTIVMVDGSYSLDAQMIEKLRNWVANGGTLIVIRKAVNWAITNGLAPVTLVEETALEGLQRPYASLSQDLGSEVVGGAIVQAKLDITHPLCFGYSNELLPLFRKGNICMNIAKNSYATPVKYTDDPLLSGYISQKNQNRLKNTASVIVCGIGSGRVICFADNPNFRAFWFGTNKLFANAVFFGRLVDGNAIEVVGK